MIYRFGDGLPAMGSPLGMRSDVEINNPLYQVNDSESADIQTVKRVVGEMIRVNGAPTKIHIRTDNEDVDTVWDEDPDPTYWAPKDLKGFFIPQPLEFELTQWGVDASNNQVEIVYTLEDIYAMFNSRLLRTGDLIEIPFNSVSSQKPKYYYVNNAQEFGNHRYIWLYVKCNCSLLTGDVNIRPANDQLDLINFDIPESNHGT